MKEIIRASILTSEDFTDKSIINFFARPKVITIAEYSNFLTNSTIRNDLSEDVIRFIADYDGGGLRPDKCNAYEPIDKPFLSKNLSQPISWLSQPGGAFYFKKNKGLKVEGAIENLRLSPIWSDGELLKPIVAEPIFLGKIKIFIQGESARKKGLVYWLDFLNGLCNVTKTKTAIVQLQDENENVHIEENNITISPAARSFFL